MITRQVTFDDFWTFLNNKDSSYYHYFSYAGAKALFDYLEEVSDWEERANIDYDPIAWCVEFSEYPTALKVYNQYHGEDTEGEGTAVGDDNTAENAEAQALEWLNDNTTVIEFDDNTVDGRGIIIADF